MCYNVPCQVYTVECIVFPANMAPLSSKCVHFSLNVHNSVSVIFKLVLFHLKTLNVVFVIFTYFPHKINAKFDIFRFYFVAPSQKLVLAPSVIFRGNMIQGLLKVNGKHLVEGEWFELEKKHCLEKIAIMHFPPTNHLHKSYGCCHKWLSNILKILHQCRIDVFMIWYSSMFCKQNLLPYMHLSFFRYSLSTEN